MPAYSICAYYAHGRQRRCQEDPVSLPSGKLEKTTRSSPHHVAQHRPTGSETTPPYAPRSSRFGSEPPSVEDDVDAWRYAILELHARNDDDCVWFVHWCRYSLKGRTLIRSTTDSSLTSLSTISPSFQKPSLSIWNSLYSPRNWRYCYMTLLLFCGPGDICLMFTILSLVIKLLVNSVVLINYSY